MHTERRPYATTLYHSGYLSKPLPLSTEPPADAIRVLNAEVGLDSVAGRGAAHIHRYKDMLAAAGSSAPAAAGQLLESLRETFLEDPEIFAAKLRNPFDYATRTYHSSQQAVLNAELRFKLEKLVEDWRTHLLKFQELVSQYPLEGTTFNTQASEGLRSYFVGYRCTEDLTVSPPQLVHKLQLHSPITELDEVDAVPKASPDGIHQTLNTLLTANFLLAPLEDYAASLQVLDTIARPEEVETEAVTAGIEEDVGLDAVAMAAADGQLKRILPSRVAVSFHERCFYRPGAYALAELKKTERVLCDMEKRVLLAKNAKETAIERSDPIEALRSLHSQIDFSNNLLLLNKARMELVQLHGEDVRSMREGSSEVIEDARQALEKVRQWPAALLPRLTHDIGALKDGMDSTQACLDELEAQEQVATEQVHQLTVESQAEEKAYWDQLQALLAQLIASAERKQQSVMQHMAERERRARAYTAAQEILKAQETHLNRLLELESTVLRWEQAGACYAKFVDAFVPKLLKHLNAVEDEHRDLYQREAEDYVRRYEMFVYVAEEARAKRAVQADRMRLTQRSMQLNQECATATLDPEVQRHAQRYAEASRELEEVLEYIKYLQSLQDDRKAEVEPILQRVLARAQDERVKSTPALTAPPLCLQAKKPLQAAPKRARGNAQSTPAAHAPPASPLTSTSTPPPAGAAHPTPKEEPVERALAVSEVVTDVAAGTLAPAAVAHPYVAARYLGIAHEELYTEKHRTFNETELTATEQKMEDIRKTRTWLDSMADKYHNADYIRGLLSMDNTSTDARRF